MHPIVLKQNRHEKNPLAHSARALKCLCRLPFRQRGSISWPTFTVGGVETIRVRQENTLAGFGAEINSAPMKIRLRVISRVAADGAVADGFGECQLFFRGVRRRDEEGVTFSPVMHISRGYHQQLRRIGRICEFHKQIVLQFPRGFIRRRRVFLRHLGEIR
jgi:hypothetical protein